MAQMSLISVGYSVSGKYNTEDTQIANFHGDPYDKTMEEAVGRSVRASHSSSDVAKGGVFSGLYRTGYTIMHPWTACNWGMETDYYGRGGHGLSAVNNYFPDGMIHVVGTSMGGFNAACWASKNVERVASLTLISPAVDMMSEFDLMRGNIILDSIAQEFCGQIADDPMADRVTFEAALTGKGLSRQQLAAALEPISDRIYIVSATNDVVVPISGPQTLAAELGLPPERAVFFDSGSSSTRHPARFEPSLGWDENTTLRNITRNKV